MNKQRVYSQKSGALNESDRLELARLLLKAGYTVNLGREKPAGKQGGAYVYFVEYWENNRNE
jgi:hypothetical protein